MLTWFADLFGQKKAVSQTSPLPTAAVSVQRWRSGFSKVLAALWDTDEWQVVGALGAGTSINQSAGAGNLVSGQTINAETILRAKYGCTGPQRAKLWAQLPTRQTNQSFYIELVDIIGDALACTCLSSTSVRVTIPNNPFTPDNVGQSLSLGAIAGVAGVPGRYAIAAVSGNDVTFTVAGWPASGSGTLSLFGWNFARVTLDGTTNTAAKFDCARNGWASGDTSVTVNATAAPGGIYSIDLLENYAYLFDKLSASSTTAQFAQRASRERNLPDEDATLFLQIRVVNGTSAPGASATLTVDSLSLEDIEIQPATILPSQGTGNGQTVTVANSPSVTALGQAAVGATAGTTPVGQGVEARTTAPTVVANGQVARVPATTYGVPLCRPYTIPDLEWYNSLALTTTSDVALKAAAAAGIKNHTTWVWMINTGGAAVDVIFKDGSTERIRFTLPINVPVPMTFPTGAFQVTAATVINVALSAAGTVRLLGGGYTAP